LKGASASLKIVIALFEENSS